MSLECIDIPRLSNFDFSKESEYVLSKTRVCKILGTFLTHVASKFLQHICIEKSINKMFFVKKEKESQSTHYRI